MWYYNDPIFDGKSKDAALDSTSSFLDEEFSKEAEAILESALFKSSEDVTVITGEDEDELVIEVISADGGEKNYTFVYYDETFSAIYTPDHWKIIDSYKITSASDMEVICQALIDIHPVHGADMVSYRSADDMAYEWLQHNVAYEYLPEDNAWRAKCKDVDFNPEDQGKTFYEIYEERTGEEFDFSLFVN
ncbi:hypothetical protein [Butyrivibrio proteoclasticus]|uniref:hypothetical protein n=1 Tax=Butyrivibrio proteoclasticus TaxID=43305 RepID=UPI00047EC938|nr:hypothetical protein [Butyrivibrio proteoclasticus]